MALRLEVFATYPTRPMSAFVTAGTEALVIDETLGAIYRQHTGTGVNQVNIWRTDIVLPVDYVSFVAVGGFVRRQGAVDSITVDFNDNTTTDAAINGLSILPVSDNVWTTWSAVPSGTYAAGRRIVLEINSTVDSGEKSDIRGIYMTIRTTGGRKLIKLVNQANISMITGAGAAGTTGQVADPASGSAYHSHAGTGANQVASRYRYWRTDPSWSAWEVPALSFDMFRTGSTDSAALSIWRNGTLVVNAQDVYPASADTWTPTTVSIGSAGWSPLDEVLLKLTTQVDNAGEIRTRRHLYRYS